MPTIPEQLDAIKGQYASEINGWQGQVAANQLALQAMNADVDGLHDQLIAAQAEIAKLQSAPIVTSGYDVAPGQSIQAILNKAGVGKTVRVAPGTYNEALTVPAGVTIDLGTAILEGASKWAPAIKVSANGTAKGGTVQNWKGGTERTQGIVQLVGDSATVEEMTFSANSGSAMTSNNVQSPSFLNNYIASSGGSWCQFGGGASVRCNNARVIGNVVNNFNTDKNNTTGPGINKFTRLNNAVFYGNRIGGGFGPAFWFDTQNQLLTVAGNGISNCLPVNDVPGEAYKGAGIWVEISDGKFSYIIGNTIGKMAAAISIQESTGFTIAANTCSANIELRNMANRAYTDSTGTHPMKLADILIAGNTMLNGAVANHLSDPSSANYAGNPTAYFKANNVVWA